VNRLGEYTDAEAVRRLVGTQAEAIDASAEIELKRVSARLTEIEQGFLNDLERVDREIMTEAEYLKRQELRREERKGLEDRKAELESTVATQRDVKLQCQTVPAKIRSFLEEYPTIDVRLAKARLQGILKAVHVYRDGSTELEFR